jgi:hypothetical protein
MYLGGGFKPEKHRGKNRGKQAGRLWGGAKFYRSAEHRSARTNVLRLAEQCSALRKLRLPAQTL